MKKEQTLAEFLGTDQPQVQEPVDSVYAIPETLGAREFAQRFLNSPEFKRYLVGSLTLGELPAAVITRMMDYAWGKPVERVEHTGRDGQPIVTEVRRIIVRADVTDAMEHLENLVNEKPERHH